MPSPRESIDSGGLEIQRRTVLEPLVGPTESPEEQAAQIEYLVEFWHWRLETLQRAGYSWLSGRTAMARRAMARAWDCPPSFGSGPSRRRRCGLLPMCPFCWARAAQACWRGLDSAFSQNSVLPDGRLSIRPELLADPKRPPEDRELLREAIEDAHRRRAAIQAGELVDGYDLAYWSFSERTPVEGFDTSTGRPLRTLWHWIDERRTSECYDKYFGNWIEGALDVIQVSIVEGQWEVSHASLALIPSGAILPFRWRRNLTEQGKIQILPRPGRKDLRALAIKLFRYPAELLVCEQPALVVEVAVIAADLRLWLPFGRIWPRPNTLCP